MPQVITTILLDDNPNGVKIAELSNWKGQIFIIPRNHLNSVRDRAEMNQAGIYFLFGDGEDRPLVYIGQSENCASRLTYHDRDREDEQWNTAIVFTGGLHGTYIKYLESIAVKTATNANRYEVINRTAPTENQLTEAQKITADEFFKKIKFLVTFFGFQLFQSVRELSSDKVTYHLKADGADAKAQLLDDGSLNVLKGSLARIRETEAFFGWSKAARKKFLEDGTLVDNEDGISYKFTKDAVFNSPTAAAATVTGRPINGWTAWKDESGKTLDENIRK
ncbi:MAG: GIY-YIG nuclease family protein [Patescibacteria group bacterium]